MGILIGVLEQGFIYSIMALGVYVTYKILDFPDMTTDGSFPCGAAVTAVLLTKGVNPYLTTLIAFLVGLFIGSITGIIHVKFKIRDLLSGIIMMTGLYSINLRIAGKANVPLFTQQTVFDNNLTAAILPESMWPYQTVLIALIFTVIMKLILDWYLNTKSGFLLRATGNNDTLVTTLAKNKDLVKVTGLAIGNAFVAMGGSIMCQQQRFFDVSMGTGTVVIGLASVIIGTNVFKNMSFIKTTTAVIIGSVIYKGCVAIAIACGMSASDMKLITAALFLIILIITMDRKRKVKRNA